MLIGSEAEVLIGSDFADSADCESGGLKASLLQHQQPAQSKIKVNQQTNTAEAPTRKDKRKEKL